MRKIPMLLLAGLLSACSNGVEKVDTKHSKEIRLPITSPAFKAAQYLNYAEVSHRAELKELTGVDPVRTEWCAAFVNSVLEETGIESNKDHKYPLTARAFLDWGQKVSKENIQPGDVVVFPRGNKGWQGHVGFYLKTEIINGKEYYLILGGNQNNRVSIATYRSNRALGIRRQSSV